MCGESRTHGLEGIVEGRPSTTTLQFSKVKRRFVVEIREVSDTPVPNVGVCGDTPV